MNAVQPSLPYVEKDCVFEFEGKKFESGGAVLAPCTDGYWRGVVYECALAERRVVCRGVLRSYPGMAYNGPVKTWHGEVLATAGYGRLYRGNFNRCRLRVVVFTWNGIKFRGVLSVDGGQMIRVRSTRKVEKEAAA